MINNSYKNGILVTMPKLFIIFILMAIALPLLGIFFGFELGVNWSHKSVTIYHALYYWSISLIAAIIVLLAFTHYHLTRDNVALSLGASYLFAAFFNAIFTLSNEWVHPISKEVENMHAYVWLLSNALTGMLLVLSLSACLLKRLKHQYLLFVLFTLLFLFIVSNSYKFISWLLTMEKLKVIIYPEKIMTHPFGLINLSLNLYLALAIYPRLNKKSRSILTHSVVYIALTQIAMSCYMIFGSIQIYDTAYLSALFLQLLSYLIPFIALILTYLSSYDFALASQKALRVQKEKFEQLSTYDPLTQLLNRRAFEEITEKIIADSKRYGYKFTFLYIDLDNFKSINDSIGHYFGDALIKQVSQRLQQSIRASDYCARLGGDEFGIILPKTDFPRDISLVAQKLIDVLNQPFDIQGKHLHTGVSIGIAIYPETGDSYYALLKNADTAMYQAKTSGKNTYAFYTENLSKTRIRELEIESYLRDALQKNEFYLKYQPIYNLATKQMIGSEVLLRWKNPHLGKVMPQEFIKIAENSGLIIPLGQWILENACQQIQVWTEKYQKILKFSINLSPLQLSNANFIKTIEAILRKNNIKEGMLDLELTETALLEHRLSVEKNIIILAKLGIGLSLDDFGTGYSSLRRLKTLPISSLKIDTSFTKDIERNSDSAIIVEAIIQLAQHLQKKVIAEGIETENQLKFLTERGCHFGQGFLLGKPLSAAEFELLAYQP